MESLQELSDLMQQGRAKNVKALTQKLLDEGVPAKKILEESFLAGMTIVGVKFKNNEIFVPEVLIAARAMNAGMDVLKPSLVRDDIEPVGTAVLGTVRGDLHDIGKNLVGMMLKGKGLKVVDLGADVPPEAFIAAAKENNAQVICCSALLTTTMKEMGNIVRAVNESDLKGKVKVMIGGAPVNAAFCASIGADRYTPDAPTCAEVAAEFCKAG